ncbi:MAG: NUDIX domain-containing protein [Phycisphaerae bacterium]|nr:NUDIX domain-containing protein [Phycisphaerae bacterium]
MSIPKTFIYCPKCSARALKPSSPKSIVCSECGFEYFFNPAAAVAGLIANDAGQLLVTVRAADPGKGSWDLPGGFIDPGETAEHALAREIFEELNLDVASMDYFGSAPNEYTYKGVTYSTLDMAFICHVADFSMMKALDDIEQAIFLPPESIDLDHFAFPSIRTFVERFIAAKREDS